MSGKVNGECKLYIGLVVGESWLPTAYSVQVPPTYVNHWLFNIFGEFQGAFHDKHYVTILSTDFQSVFDSSSYALVPLWSSYTYLGLIFDAPR